MILEGLEEKRMSSETGKNIKISVFGQSHSEAIGVVVDGIPAGESFDLAPVLEFMKRRAPSGKAYTTMRKETDEPEILSGLLRDEKAEGEIYVSCGAPVCAVIRNRDTRSADYENLRFVPRPSHADYPAYIKYKGFNDIRGGGQFSGRLTAPLCFAGALCIELLKKRGINVGAHIFSVGDIRDKSFETVALSLNELKAASVKEFPVIEEEAGERMRELIAEAKGRGDSVGGIVECAVTGLPAGLGDPMFDGVENIVSRMLFAIPAVKGVEFGDGFGLSSSFGSLANDPYELREGKILTKTNHNGGILGGITTGMPLIVRAAFKPTPSIALSQDSVDLLSMKEEKLTVKGRHDPCIVPRAVPCVEAAVAIALCDLMLS
jgi:chorismate synthase